MTLQRMAACSSFIPQYLSWFFSLTKKMFQIKIDLYQMENLHDFDDGRLVHHPISDAYMDKNWNQFY